MSAPGPPPPSSQAGAGVGGRPISESAPLLQQHNGNGRGDRRRSAMVTVLALTVVGAGAALIGVSYYRHYWRHSTPSSPPQHTRTHTPQAGDPPKTLSSDNHTHTKKHTGVRGGGEDTDTHTHARTHVRGKGDTNDTQSGNHAHNKTTSTGGEKKTQRRKKKKVDPRTAKFGKLIWEEEFEGKALDLKTWNVEKTLGGGGNFEFQYYCDDPDVLIVDDGKLRIQPGYFKDLGEVKTETGYYDAEEVMLGSCEPFPKCSTFHVPNCTNPMWYGCKRIGNKPWGNLINPVTSARINTKGKFSYKYGRLEFNARLPRGDFLWPALWLLPEDEKYGGWPASGEIDVMESRGNPPDYEVGGEPAGFNAFGSTLHFGNLIESDDGTTTLLDGWPNAHAVLTDPIMDDYTKDFHVFGLYWSETEMYTYTLNADGTEKVALDLTKGFFNGFWKPPLGGEGDPMWINNPYEGAPINAPFDQRFHIVINVAVGGQEGNLGYWKEAPWADCKQPNCFTQGDFWFKRNIWKPSWDAAKEQGLGALEVESLRVWELDPNRTSRKHRQ